MLLLFILFLYPATGVGILFLLFKRGQLRVVHLWFYRNTNVLRQLHCIKLAAHNRLLQFSRVIQRGIRTYVFLHNAWLSNFFNRTHRDPRALVDNWVRNHRNRLFGVHDKFCTHAQGNL